MFWSSISWPQTWTLLSYIFCSLQCVSDSWLYIALVDTELVHFALTFVSPLVVCPLVQSCIVHTDHSLPCYCCLYMPIIFSNKQCQNYFQKHKQMSDFNSAIFFDHNIPTSPSSFFYTIDGFMLSVCCCCWEVVAVVFHPVLSGILVNSFCDGRLRSERI